MVISFDAGNIILASLGTVDVEIRVPDKATFDEDGKLSEGVPYREYIVKGSVQGAKETLLNDSTMLSNRLRTFYFPIKSLPPEIGLIGGKGFPFLLLIFEGFSYKVSINGFYDWSNYGYIGILAERDEEIHDN